VLQKMDFTALAFYNSMRCCTKYTHSEFVHLSSHMWNKPKSDRHTHTPLFGCWVAKLWDQRFYRWLNEQLDTYQPETGRKRKKCGGETGI